MTPNDYNVYVPMEERETVMDELKDYRVWEEDSDEDTLRLQGHPGMGDVFREKFTYSFDECFIGTARDLWISHSYDKGEWKEEFECDEHHDGSGWKTITVEEFNELIEVLNDEDYEG